MDETRRGLLRAVGTVAASATIGWSYFSHTDAGSVIDTNNTDGGPTYPTGDRRDLLERLGSGGLVMYVPPPESGEYRAQSLAADYEECVSPLAHPARRSARRLGDALRALGVPIGSVLSSESCACLDTARLAFGRVTPSGALTDRLSDSEQADSATFEELLAMPPPYGTNRVLVGRRDSIEAVADVALEADEIAVFAPWGEGVETVGRLSRAAIDRAGSDAGPPPDSVTAYPIRNGTAEETLVYRRRSGTGGPTVFVVGGVHGNEEAGYRTATRATEWSVDDGTLVVLPRANRPAIEQGRRFGRDNRDLNRQFTLGGPPTSPLARAIWATVRRHDPDVLVDMHVSAGLLARDTGYVGQAVFHSDHDSIASRVGDVVSYLNRNVVPESRSDYEYLVDRMDGNPEGMLATKAARDADVPACIYEVTDSGLQRETQVAWTSSFLRRMVGSYGVLE